MSHDSLRVRRETPGGTGIHNLSLLDQSEGSREQGHLRATQGIASLGQPTPPFKARAGPVSLLRASGPLNRHICYDFPLRCGRATHFVRRGCSRQASSTLVEYGGTASGGRDVSALAIPHSSGSASPCTPPGGAGSRGGLSVGGGDGRGLDWPGKHATGVPRQHTLGQLWGLATDPSQEGSKGAPSPAGVGGGGGLAPGVGRHGASSPHPVPP